MAIPLELSQFAKVVEYNSTGTGGSKIGVGINTNHTSFAIGIGTTNPTATLDVKGNIIASSTLTVGDATGISGGAPTDQGVLSVYTSGTKNALIIQTDTNANSRGLAFRNSGDAYIGYISIVDRGSNLGDMVFGVSAATQTNVGDVDERLRITKDGYVGIGTANVSASLEIRATSNINGLVIDHTDLANGGSDYPHITLKSGGPQCIDFRDAGDGDGLRFSYRTTPKELRIENSEDTTTHFAIDRDDGRVDLHYGGDKKFETTGYGVSITGGLNVSGVSTIGLANTSLPPSNSQMSFELTSDTNLRIKVRGSDGVLRSADITLS